MPCEGSSRGDARKPRRASRGHPRNYQPPRMPNLVQLVEFGEAPLHNPLQATRGAQFNDKGGVPVGGCGCEERDEGSQEAKGTMMVVPGARQQRKDRARDLGTGANAMRASPTTA